MDRIGLSIDHDALRIVAVRGSNVTWTSESVVGDPQRLTAEIGTLIAAVPRAKWHRRELTGAIGSAAQVKRIAGVPANAGDRALTDAVRLNSQRFFLRNGSPLLTSNVVRREGELWCASVEEPVVAALAEACRAAGILFRGCIPSSTISATAAAPGADALLSSAAYCAAVHGERSPFLIDPGAPLRATRRRRAIRASLAFSILVASAGIAVAPALRAILRERAATSRLRELGTRSTAPLAAMRDLASAAEVVRRVNAFASSRRSAVALLGSLSQVLPESTAIVSFHIDSVGGTLVALTPVGGTILPDISRATGIVSAEITGAVTRETMGGAAVQRQVTAFRFVRSRAAKAIHAPGGAP